MKTQKDKKWEGMTNNERNLLEYLDKEIIRLTKESLSEIDNSFKQEIFDEAQRCARVKKALLDKIYGKYDRTNNR